MSFHSSATSACGSRYRCRPGAHASRDVAASMAIASKIVESVAATATPPPAMNIPASSDHWGRVPSTIVANERFGENCLADLADFSYVEVLRSPTSNQISHGAGPNVVMPGYSAQQLEMTARPGDCTAERARGRARLNSSPVGGTSTPVPSRPPRRSASSVADRRDHCPQAAKQVISPGNRVDPGTDTVTRSAPHVPVRCR
jgi:hypothetical protein